MRTINETVHYQKGSIKVTDQFLTTRYKDEALAPVQSVQVGREPLVIASVVGIGLALFARQFGDLLYWHEQILLICMGLGLIVAGYSFAFLRIGQYMHERSVLFHNIWTIDAVRKAIASAKLKDKSDAGQTIIMGEVDE